jgi:hypothetical protein
MTNHLQRWSIAFLLVASCSRSPIGATGDLAGAADMTAPAPDAANGSFVIRVEQVMAGEGCMPTVPPDPVTLSAALHVINASSTDVGPLSATSGALLDANQHQLATFQISPLSVHSIAAGSDVVFQFMKTANSLMPQNGCIETLCSGGAIVAIDYVLAGVNGRAYSQLANVACTR